MSRRAGIASCVLVALLVAGCGSVPLRGDAPALVDKAIAPIVPISGRTPKRVDLLDAQGMALESTEF